MRVLTESELTRFQETQNGAMQDTCIILDYHSVADDYGNPTESYIMRLTSSACGYEPVKTSETHGSGEVPLFDSRLRLPINTTIDAIDRIRITHRYGAAVANKDYAIIGPVKRGPSGLILNIKRIEE